MATIKTNFTEQMGSRSGNGSIGSGEASEVRIYKGEFTDNTANSVDARNGTGVPAYGSALGSYALYLMDKDAAPDPENQAVWIVKCTYRTLHAALLQPNFNVAMTNGYQHIWNVLKRSDPYPVEVPLQKDRYGKVMVNVIGEPIKPSPTTVIYDELISISFLTDLIDRTTIDSCKGKVNSATINITIGGATANYLANTLLFQAPPIEELYDQDGNKIAKVVYQLLYRKDTFTGMYPNLSFNKYGGSGTLGTGGTTNAPIMIGTGTNSALASEAQYLDAAGLPLAVGGSITIVNSGSGYDFLSTANFSTLLAGLTI